MKFTYAQRKGIRNSEKVIKQIMYFLQTKGFTIPKCETEKAWIKEIDFQWLKKSI